METETSTRGKAKSMAVIALMAAVLCILGPVTIPITGLVPISLATLALYFTVYLLGMKQALLSCVLYILLGFAGLPVFSGYAGGPAKLLGPTGGYIVGYIFMVLVCGLFIDRWRGSRVLCFAGMVLGTLVLYLFGSGWLACQAGMSIGGALAAGMLPFIPGDLLKIIAAMLLGPVLWGQLKKAGLL